MEALFDQMTKIIDDEQKERKSEVEILQKEIKKLIEANSSLEAKTLL